MVAVLYYQMTLKDFPEMGIEFIITIKSMRSGLGGVN